MGPSAQKPLFKTLKAAILTQAPSLYYFAQAAKTQRVAEPAKGAIKAAWYLQAFACARRWRTFKLCRMLGARMLNRAEPAHGAPPPLTARKSRHVCCRWS
ncbi:MAG: WYL domain-containing protein [Ruthenibacterium sp.]